MARPSGCSFLGAMVSAITAATVLGQTPPTCLSADTAFDPAGTCQGGVNNGLLCGNAAGCPGGTCVIPDAWQDPRNWAPQVPLPTDVACIKAGKQAKVCPIGFCGGGVEQGRCCVNDLQCPASACIPVSTDATTGGLVVEATAEAETLPNTTLTLHSDSVVYGILACRGPSKLLIDGHVTIFGVGGKIRGDLDNDVGEAFFSSIEAAPGSVSAKLTIAPHPTQGSNASRATSLRLQEVWIIKVEFENNAYVTGDIGQNMGFHNGAIILRGAPKSGTGFWIAEKRAEDGFIGKIIIDGPVTFPGPNWTIGPGAAWQVNDPAAGLQIDTLASFPGLTGEIQLTGQTLTLNTPTLSGPSRFKVSGGTLKVIADFTSTVGLRVTTGGAVTVETVRRARFSY